MSEYDSIAAAALRLIDRKGGALTLTRHTPAAVNKATDVETPGAPVTGNYRAVGLPPGNSAEKRIGSLVERNIIEFHIARLGTVMEPEPGDVATWGGKDWTVLNVTTYNPAADGAIYTRALAER